MMPKITVDQLRELGACFEGIRLFKEKFGEVLNVTSERQAIAVARCYWDDLDFRWAAEELLNEDGPGYDEFVDTVHEAHIRRKTITDPAYRNYKAIEEPLWEEYYRKCNEIPEYLWHINSWEVRQRMRVALDDYQTAKQPAWLKYMSIKDSTDAAYKKAQAVAFAKAWWAQEKLLSEQSETASAASSPVAA